MEICRSIILIDDDTMFNYLHKKNFVKHGYFPQLNEFVNAGDALQFMARSTSPGPIIVLLDINMPGIDGWTFLDELQQMEEHVASKYKVIMLSSSVSSADVTRAMTYKNVYGYLFKPLQMEMLQDILLRRGIELAGKKD